MYILQLKDYINSMNHAVVSYADHIWSVQLRENAVTVSQL